MGLVLALLVGLLGYAVLLNPHAGGTSGRSLPGRVPTGGPSAGHASAGPSSAAGSPGSAVPSGPSTVPTPSLGGDFTLRTDPSGFSVAVHNGWSRTVGGNSETLFSSGGSVFRLIVVKGRDTTASYGTDPLAYEVNKEPELAAFRDSAWSSSAGLQRLDRDGASAAQGEFSWREPDTGRQVYARNLVVLRNGGYDVLLLVGPDDQRPVVTDYFNKAMATFRVRS